MQETLETLSFWENEVRHWTGDADEGDVDFSEDGLAPGNGVRAQLAGIGPTEGNEDLRCGICLTNDAGDELFELSCQCQAVFHAECINTWLSTRGRHVSAEDATCTHCKQLILAEDSSTAPLGDAAAGGRGNAEVGRSLQQALNATTAAERIYLSYHEHSPYSGRTSDAFEVGIENLVAGFAALRLW